jgi:hypothetical protein
MAQYRVKVGLLIGTLCAGCSLFSKDFQPPFSYAVEVTYLSGYVKGVSRLPVTGVLVLFPIDQRRGVAVRGRELPLSEGSKAVVGFWGSQSGAGLPGARQRFLSEPEPPHFPGVIYYRPIVRGEEVRLPDTPLAFFYLSDLQGIVQEAIVRHLREGGLTAEAVLFSLPADGFGKVEATAKYALGCVIKEFTLSSQVRYKMWRESSPFFAYTVKIPVFGPVLARVSLDLSLYRWPCAELVWTEKVTARVTDPPAGETDLLYATPGEVMSVALSQAVGSLLVNQKLQDVLSTSASLSRQTLKAEVG